MAANSELEDFNKSRHDSSIPSPAVAEVGIRNAYNASDYACLERCLHVLAGVTDVRLGT